MGARRVLAWTLAGHASILTGCLVGAWFHARVPVAAAVAILCAWPALVGARRLAARLPDARAVAPIAMLLAGLSVAQTARVAAFMLDDAQTWGAAVPGVNAKHMCLAAYVRAAELSARGDANLYDRASYTGDTDVDGLAPWLSDPFQYPPAFLTGPRLALALTRDYDAMRAAWFALQAVAFGAFALVVAWSVDPALRWRAIAFIAPVWIAVPTLTNLQYGQVHLVVLAMALVAMLAFRRQQYGLGGGLLAAAISAKIFPGLLVLVLLLERRWRAVAATGVWLAGLAGVAWLVVGSAPFVAFVDYQLPRMSSGAAFAHFFAEPFAVAENQSIAGIGYKLAALGVPIDPIAFIAVAKWLWLAALAAAAWRAVGRDDTASWLALLVLASLLSPYTPGAYALAGAVWLLALLAVNARTSAPMIAAGVAAWGLWQIAPIMGDLPGLWKLPALAVVVSFVSQGAVIAASTIALRPARGAA